MPEHRIIMHVDMDAFYASVEQRDRPELRGRPVIVGGGRRGVVSAASYEARRFGIHSAMPMFMAQRLCPEGVFLPVRMERYRQVSRVVMRVLSGVSPLVEPVSIDEAFVDLTGMDRIWSTPLQAAMEVKRQILEAAGVTCSVGVAPWKFLAKIASERYKPDGLLVVTPRQARAFLSRLRVAELPGVGERSRRILAERGIEFVEELLRVPEEWVRRRLGTGGKRLVRLVRGEEEALVTPRQRPKSLSAENTFDRDVADTETLQKWLLAQSERVAYRLRAKGLRGRTVELKLKRSDFRLQTRSRTLQGYTDETNVIYETARSLLLERPIGGTVRLTGVGIKNLASKEEAPFWDAWEEEERKGRLLEKTVDGLRDRFGYRIVVRGSTLDLNRKSSPGGIVETTGRSGNGHDVQNAEKSGA